MESYLKIRPQSLLKENINAFNNIVLLFLLEQRLADYNPEARVQIVEYLMKNWYSHIDKNISKESQACRERLALSGEFNEAFWGAPTKEEVEDSMEKMLQNGKATAFTVIDNTLNDMLSNLEKMTNNNQKEDTTK